MIMYQNEEYQIWEKDIKENIKELNSINFEFLEYLNKKKNFYLGYESFFQDLKENKEEKEEK